MSGPLIEVKDLKKIYRMGTVEVHALRGVTLEVEEGEYLAIMGPSGSGKSTLMHIIGCLDTPTEGIYLLEGMKVHELSEPELAEVRKSKIGFVFQNFNLLPRLTAIENVSLPMVYRGVPAKERRRRAMELLELVGLGERANHRPTELSGGEAQRVAIARALSNNPRILLADEPTGNLDTKTGEEILSIFEELNRMGRTVIVVTHDPEVARRAKRIVRLRDGIVED
jgi:putative ABC transport system ATP-binding protein